MAVLALLQVCAALALATTVVLWRTWPFAGRLHTGLPVPDSDWLYTSWTLAWQVDALRAGVSPVQAPIYAPTTDALFYGPLATGLLPFFAPAYLWTGDALTASKMAYLAALVATGLSVHLVVQSLTRSWIAGAVAVLALFASNEIFVMPGHAPQWAALCWFAPLVWAIGRTTSWRGAAAVALIAAAQYLTEPMYVAPAVGAVLAAAAIARLLQRSSRTAGLWLLVATAASIVLVAPLLYGYLRVRAANPGLGEQTVWVRFLFGTPWEDAAFQARLLLGLLAREVPVLAIAPLVIAALVVRRPGGWLDTTLLATVPFVLAVATPFVRVAVGIDDGTLRVPGRLILGGFVGLGLLAGLAWHQLTERRFLAILALLPMVVWYARLETPRMYAGPGLTQTPPIVAHLLRSSTGPVLELPAGTRTAMPNARAMYRALAHGRPLVNGYSSYWPEAWTARMADAEQLPDAAALERLVDATGVTTLVVHLNDMRPQQRARWRVPLNPPTPGLVPLFTAGDVLVFAVRPDQAIARKDHNPGTAPAVK